MQSWLEGRLWVGKCAQATAMTASLRILSSKADSNTLESFTRSGLKLEWVHQESPHSGKGLPSHFWNRNIVRSILPGLRRKITGLLLNGPKSSFQIKVKVHFAFHLEIKVWRKSGEAQNPSCLKSSVTFLKSGMIWGDVCWCWSIVFYQVQSQCSHLPGDFRALYASIWKYFKLKIEMFIIVGAERLRAHIQHKHSSCK